MKDILTEREEKEFWDAVGDLGGLQHAVDIEHKTGVAPRDQIIMQAVRAMYESAPKHPDTGELFRPHAGQIKYYLNQLTDDGLVERYKSVAHLHGQPVGSYYAFMARMMHILINEKHLWAKVEE